VTTQTLCYVVPYLSASTEQHYAHLPSLLLALREHARVWVIAERSDPGVDLEGIRVMAQKRADNRVARVIELARLLWRVRRQGCRNVFVRIAPVAGIVCATWGRLIGLRSFYWVSGQGRNVLPSGRGIADRMARTRFKLAETPNILAMRLSSCLVTGPESMVDYYASEYGIRRSHIRLLYNHVDLAPYELRPVAAERRAELRRELGISEDGPVVLFVGRVSRLKGGQNLPAVVRATLARVPEAMFVVVGEVHLPAVQDQIAGEFGDAVRFVGAVPNPATRSYFEAADVFILPSESEGFPRVVLEAMAAGTPVVAYDVGGVSDLLAGGLSRMVVPRGDAKAMADRVAEVVTDHEVSSELRRLGFAAVSRYGAKDVAKMLVEDILTHT
jgi:glycosyltransferase involved in cell wall biosynthesis